MTNYSETTVLDDIADKQLKMLDDFRKFRSEIQDTLSQIQAKWQSMFEDLRRVINESYGPSDPISMAADKILGPIDSDPGSKSVYSSENDEQNEACYVLNKMIDPVPTGLPSFSPIYVSEDEALFLVLEDLKWLFEENDQSSPLKLEVGTVDHQLFGKMPELITGEPTEGNGGLKSFEVSTMCLWKDLGYENGVIGISSTKFSSKSKIELNVKLWVGEISMMVFDPGGSSLSHSCRDSFLVTNDKKHFDKFAKNGKTLLTSLLIVYVSRKSGKAVGMMVVDFGGTLLDITTYECLAKALAIWNLSVHNWWDFVAAFIKVKMDKSLTEPSVRSHGPKVSGFLIEGCKFVTDINKGQNDRVWSFNAASKSGGAAEWYNLGIFQYWETLDAQPTVMMYKMSINVHVWSGWESRDIVVYKAKLDSATRSRMIYARTIGNMTDWEICGLMVTTFTRKWLTEIAPNTIIEHSVFGWFKQLQEWLRQGLHHEYCITLMPLYFAEGQVGLDGEYFSLIIHAEQTVVGSIGFGKRTVVVKLENSVWDPGWCVTITSLRTRMFFKRTGKSIISMVYELVIMIMALLIMIMALLHLGGVWVFENIHMVGVVTAIGSHIFAIGSLIKLLWQALGLFLGDDGMHGLGIEALDMFRDLSQTKLKPNEITFVGVLSACCHVVFICQGQDFLAQMLPIYGVMPTIEHYACVIVMLGRAGTLKEAYELLLTMPYETNSVVWGAFLAASQLHDNSDLANVASQRVFELEPDVNRAIQHVHKSGLVHKGILVDTQRYMVKNDKLLCFLRMLKDTWKNLFLLTNSPYYFVDGGMRYLLEGTLGPQESWRQLFDVVIAKADKSNFYMSNQPFRCYDVEEITKWNGPEVIYFGDHLFSDLRGPSKAGWHTAAIVHEVEKEIQIQNSDNYCLEQAKFHILQELLGKLHATVANSQRTEAYESLLEAYRGILLYILYP